MKKYRIKLLTQRGIIEREISEGDDLDKLSNEIQKEYGTFITLSSTPIN